MRRLTFLVPALLILLSQAVQAQCAFSFQDVRQENQQPYSTFRPGSNVIDMGISVQQQDCDALSFSFTSDNNGMLVGAAGKVQYRLQTRSGQTIELRGNSLYGARALLEQQPDSRLLLRSLIDPGAFPSPGSYGDRLTLTAYDSGVAVSQIRLPISLQVSPEADISFTGTASSGYSANSGGSINFGTLESGEERFAFLFVRSNVNYALSLSSENHGYLVHDRETGNNARIPYSAWLDQSPLNLAMRSTIHTGAMTPVYQGRAHKLDVRIGNVADKIAGDYHDLILVEVVFLE